MSPTDDVVLDVVKSTVSDWKISEAITGGELVRTIEGASTLTLTVHDPDRELIRSKGLQYAVDLQYDGTWFRLVKMTKSGTEVTLTFEDRDVAYLRTHTKPRKVSRNKMTRAQFVRSLIREVQRNRIRFFCPEVNERQPIGKTKQDAKPKARTPKTRADDKQRGLAKGAQLAVKGVGATPEQRRNGQRVLDVADQLGAGPKATKALIAACIVESTMKIIPLGKGDRDSAGILQVRVSTSGSESRSLDIEWCVKKFLRDGFYRDPLMGSGGAMEKARKFPNASAGRVAQATQGSGVPNAYDIFADEAQDWLDAYGGASGVDTGGSGTAAPGRKRYEFARGEPGKREDSWTCIQRLAQEVNWRAFMDQGTLYFVSQDRLIAARASYVVSEDTDGVNWIDFDIDQGKAISEASVSARTDLFDVRIGSVMAVRDMGRADGRYIVTDVRRSLFSTDTDITLKRATPTLPEPSAESTAGPSGGQGDVAVAGGSLREKIVAVAEASMKSYQHNKGAWFYSQNGASNADDPTRPPSRGKRSDCSQWVAAVYKKAGAPSPCSGDYATAWTGNMKVKGHAVGISDLRPGDVVIFGAGSGHHVELFVGPGNRTIGHGSAPVDYGTTTMQSAPQGWRYSFLDD